MADSQTSTPLPPIPPNKSGEAIYDSIMQEIEPELMTKVLPTLEEKYKNETPEQKTARAERYTKAFTEYEKRYQAYLLSEESKLRTFKRAAFKGVEERTGEDDRARLTQIDSLLST